MINVDYIFNDIFRKIRLELGYTQNEFAELLHCTQAQVSRIESNERPVSNEILNDLSNLYKVDLRNNLNVFTNFKNFEVFEKYRTLVMYQNLNKYDFLDELEKELKDPIIEAEFNYGELELIKNLSYAMVECFVHKDFEKAIEYAMKNMDCTEEELYTYNPSTIKSPFFYSSITILCVSSFHLQKIDLTLALCGNIFEHYNTVWTDEINSFATNEVLYKMQNTFFYIIYAFILFKSEMHVQAFQVCELIAAKSKELNILNMLCFMLFIKFQVIYKLGDIESARDAYFEFNSVLKYSELPKETYTFTGYNVGDYPLLFE